MFGKLILGGGPLGVVPVRTFAALACLILACLTAATPAQALDGKFTVTESWKVTIQDGRSLPQTTTGVEHGTLSIVNGQYSLIDHTGISGGDTNIYPRTISGGPPYAMVGEYPYAGTAVSTGFVAVIHLGFFSVAIHTSTPSDATLNVSKSTKFAITGSSLTGLTGSGTQDNGDYYFFTATSTSSLTQNGTNGPPPPPMPFFTGQAALGNNVYYLAAGTNHIFGYYSLLNFPYVYHYDLGFEYFTDATNATHGAYLYDFATTHYWYTEPDLFPYLYDFTLNAWLYYFPDTNRPGFYTTNPRYFYNFGASKVITL